MAKKKSSFYHVRYNRVGINERLAAEILGVSVEDVQRYDKDGSPIMAERLLMLWDKKRVGVDGWDGFMFSRGVLIYKKQRWTPRLLMMWHEQNAEIVRLQGEINHLKSWRGLKKTLSEKIKLK